MGHECVGAAVEMEVTLFAPGAFLCASAVRRRRTGPSGDFATPTDVDGQVFERLFDAVFETFLLPPNRALSFDRILHTEAALKVGCQAFW